MKIRAMLLTLLATAAISLTGCATNPPFPTPHQIATADYGAPLTIDWQAAIKRWCLKNLHDPLSAQYKFKGPPQKGYTQTVLKGTMFDYFTVVEVNAKDSFGSYIGFQPYLFIFKNNYIIKVAEPGDFNYNGKGMGTELYLD